MSSGVSIYDSLAGINIGSDYHINSDQIRLIQTAQSKKEIRSIWGIIKDWFFGTHREEAKQALFDLCNIADRKVKLQAFSKLEKLSAPGFKQQFFIAATNSEQKIMLCIGKVLMVELSSEVLTVELGSEEDGQPDHCHDLMERITEWTEPTEELSVERQLDLIRKDIICSVGVHYTFCCCISGVTKDYWSGDGIHPQDKRDMVDRIENMIGYTPYQKKMLGFLMCRQLCEQMQACRYNDGFRFLESDWFWDNYDELELEPSYKQYYTMTTLNNGTIKVDVQYEGENPKMLFGQQLKAGEKAFRKICMEASFLIRRDEDKTELLFADWQGTGLYKQKSKQSQVRNYV